MVLYILFILLFFVYYTSLNENNYISLNEHFNENNDNENNENNENNNYKIEIVISRYNENLEWLKNSSFENYPITIYNKGINNNFYNNNYNIINLKNVGRCDHTYFYHIINNYNNLADITLFLPGSCNLEYKYIKALTILDIIKKAKKTVLSGYYIYDLKNNLYDFILDVWKSSDEQNIIANTNDNHKLTPSNIRPYGKWYENNFGNKKNDWITFLGIHAIKKDHLLKNSKEYYIKFLKELEVSSNPEVGHYIERSYSAILNNEDDIIYNQS
jgi:hypothetical protein